MLAIITPVGPEGPALGQQKAIEGESLGSLISQAASHVERLRSEGASLLGADIIYHSVGGSAIFRLRGERL